MEAQDQNAPEATTSTDEQTETESPRDTASAEKPRGRSTIAFPYLHLDGCLEIARAVRTLGVDACEWDQLAAQTGHAGKGGTFRQKMLAARVFGLLSYRAAEVKLTPAGLKALDSETAKVGRVEAFLNVQLFRQMYEKLAGRDMPPQLAIQQQMQTLGVAPKQTAKARQVFVRSARDAGFFEINPDRMTKPAITSAREPDEPNGNSEGAQAQARDREEHSLRRAVPHPLISALLAEMPEAGTTWEQARCVMWLEGVLISLGMIYENFEELRQIEISVRQQSS